MNVDMLMTDEQEKALNVQRNSTFYEHKKTIVNSETGEIVSESIETIGKTSGEPDFVKLYYKTMLIFNGADDIPLKFILAMSEYMSWTNEGKPMVFNNTKMVKEQICKSCKIKESMYTKYITRCRENGLIFPLKGYRGTYEVNPFFIAKGKWDSIKQLRTTFDFIGGKWERVTEFAEDEEEK